MRTVRNPADEVGRTHASRVIPVVKSSELESGTTTTLPIPLNDSALPNLHEVFQVAPVIEPALPLPDRSASVVPAPSSEPSGATRPAERKVRFSRTSRRQIEP